MSANTKIVFIVGAVLVALAVAFGATMRGVTAVGGARTEGHAIPLQGATTARIDLTMDSGELRLGRGDDGLLDAAFTYNVGAWEPDITYQVISREGVLRVEQGDIGGPFPVLTATRSTFGTSLSAPRRRLTSASTSAPPTAR